VVGDRSDETFDRLNLIQSVEIRAKNLQTFFSALWNVEMGGLLDRIDDTRIWGIVVGRLLETKYMSDVIRVISSDILTWERADQLMLVSTSIGSDLAWLPFLIANLLGRSGTPSLLVRLVVELKDQALFMETVRELRREEIFFHFSPDFYHVKLVIRYMLLDTATVWDRQELTDMITSSSSLLGHASVIVRFAVSQLLAVMTEVIPTGRLMEFKSSVFRELECRMDVERTLVVRRQLAIAITSWINVVS